MKAGAIQLADVRFRWRPQDPLILDIPALSIAAGERVLIRGPSGSGKTTLLSLLGGIAAPEAGRVAVLGTDLATLRPARRDAFRADHIGFVFQMFNLVPYLSLVDNVTLPCRFSAVRRQTSLQNSDSIARDAARLLQHMELDVNALRGRPVTELSAGQQQRVAVARALIGAPPLIIADEPTSALDADARHAFLDLLFREVGRADATLVFVSHDRDLGTRFDRTVALADVNRVT